MGDLRRKLLESSCLNGTSPVSMIPDELADRTRRLYTEAVLKHDLRSPAFTRVQFSRTDGPSKIKAPGGFLR